MADVESDPASTLARGVLEPDPSSLVDEDGTFNQNKFAAEAALCNGFKALDALVRTAVAIPTSPWSYSKAGNGSARKWNLVKEVRRLGTGRTPTKVYWKCVFSNALLEEEAMEQWFEVFSTINRRLMENPHWQAITTLLRDGEEFQGLNHDVVVRMFFRWYRKAIVPLETVAVTWETACGTHPTLSNDFLQQKHSFLKPPPLATQSLRSFIQRCFHTCGSERHFRLMVSQLKMAFAEVASQPGGNATRLIDWSAAQVPPISLNRAENAVGDTLSRGVIVDNQSRIPRLASAPTGLGANLRTSKRLSKQTTTNVGTTTEAFHSSGLISTEQPLPQAVASSPIVMNSDGNLAASAPVLPFHREPPRETLERLTTVDRVSRDADSPGPTLHSPPPQPCEANVAGGKAGTYPHLVDEPVSLDHGGSNDGRCDTSMKLSYLAEVAHQQKLLVETRTLDLEDAESQFQRADEKGKRLQAELREAVQSRDAARVRLEAAELRLHNAQDAQSATAKVLLAARQEIIKANLEAAQKRRAIQSRLAASEAAAARRRARETMLRSHLQQLLPGMTEIIVARTGLAMPFPHDDTPFVSLNEHATRPHPLPGRRLQLEGAPCKRRVESATSVYKSPLLQFRSFRCSPSFSEGSGQSLTSVTFSNKLHPAIPLCKHDLHGHCNDLDCQFQHREDYNLSGNELLLSLASYEREKWEGEDKLMSWVESAVGSHLKAAESLESKAKMVAARVFTRTALEASPIQQSIVFNTRSWRPSQGRKRASAINFEVGAHPLVPFPRPGLKRSRKHPQGSNIPARHASHGTSILGPSRNIDVCTDRYFSPLVSDNCVSELEFEKKLEANPDNVALWLEYADRILGGDLSLSPQSQQAKGTDAAPELLKASASDLVDSSSRDAEAQGVNVANAGELSPLGLAADVLSRALETNSRSEELWYRYLEVCVECVGITQAGKAFDMGLKSLPSSKRLWWLYIQSQHDPIIKLSVCDEYLEVLRLDGTAKSHEMMRVVLFASVSECRRGCFSRARARLRAAVASDASWPDSTGGRSVCQIGEAFPSLSGTLVPRHFVMVFFCYVCVSDGDAFPPSVFGIEDEHSCRLLMDDPAAMRLPSTGRLSVRQLELLLSESVRRQPSLHPLALRFFGEAFAFRGGTGLGSRITVLCDEWLEMPLSALGPSVLEKQPLCAASASSSQLSTASEFMIASRVERLQFVFKVDGTTPSFKFASQGWESPRSVAQLAITLWDSGSATDAISALVNYAARLQGKVPVPAEKGDNSTTKVGIHAALRAFRCHLKGSDTGLWPTNAESTDPDLWLCNCLLTAWQSTTSATVDVFEMALKQCQGTVDGQWKIWWQYLRFSRSIAVLQGSAHLQELAERCLVWILSSGVDVDQGRSFLCQVVQLLVGCLPQQAWQFTLSNLAAKAPSNGRLTAWAALVALAEADQRRAQGLLEQGLRVLPRCSLLWSMRLQISQATQTRQEHEKLLESALQVLPSSARVWHHVISHERKRSTPCPASEGKMAQRLQEAGLCVQELHQS